MVLTIPFMFIGSPVGLVIGTIIGVIFAGLLIFAGGTGMLGVGASIIWLIIAGAAIIWGATKGGSST